MNEHLQDLKSGGRPMTKLELANKEIERLKEELKYSISIVEHNKTIQSNINSYNKLAKYNSDLEDRIDKAIAFIKSEKAIKCSGISIKNFEAYENYLLSVLEGSDKE